MAILVTGGAGYIGSHTVLELLAAGEKVVVLDNLSTGFRSAVPEDVPLIQGDFGDEDLVTELLAKHDVEAIIHFAAKIVVPDSVADPLGYYLNNTAMARTLLACAVDCGVKHFIFSSTAAVYGEPAQVPVSESETLKPMSPYGRSKLMVEWMLEDTAKAHALSYVVLRYFNVAGADPQGRIGQSTPNATHLIKVAVQTALGRRQGMDVYGTDYPTPDGSCLRDYIQVTDLARAHVDALRYLRAGGGNLTCNVGYARGYSVLDVIDVVKQVSGVDFAVRKSGRRPGDPAAIVAANDRIRAELGWKPQHDNLSEIVRQALDWERRLHNRSP
ncbi:MAG: UDP-glucose 4-epimerase [Methylobacteriaceae bacterium]|jgi:UDP-glucose 4-epimerase|nr:UDP-glucose 4-epimerase [Methylobacteriaceae bacterium]